MKRLLLFSIFLLSVAFSISAQTIKLHGKAYKFSGVATALCTDADLKESRMLPEGSKWHLENTPISEDHDFIVFWIEDSEGNKSYFTEWHQEDTQSFLVIEDGKKQYGVVDNLFTQLMIMNFNGKYLIKLYSDLIEK